MSDKTFPTMTQMKKKGHKQSKHKVWFSNYRHLGQTERHTNKTTKDSDNLLIRINQEYWRGIPGFKYHTTGRLILITRQVYNFLESNAKKPIFLQKYQLLI